MKYKDSRLSCEVRAKDLLERMTLTEKVGQLNQRLYGFRAYEREGDTVKVSDTFKDEVKRWSGIGVLYGLYRADPWSARNYETGISREQAVKTYNLLQSYVMEHSRLEIPMLLSTECPHGHQALDGYLLPVNLAMGAAFSKELVYQAYRVCGKQMRELGVDLALISLLDILRDPRWGRSEECFGEDPYLASALSASVIKGVMAEGVEVVAKHLAAQGETTGGVNASAARIGERELREIHLPPVKACVDAGVSAVMAAYNEIDGILCHANSWLLQQVLGKEMGFDGIVMADGFAVDRLEVLTGDIRTTGAKALNAGVDVSLWDEGFTHLEQGVKDGLISEGRLDEAVLKVLTMKFRRGLFEHPLLGEAKKKVFTFSAEKENLELARQSAVLLKNEGELLPLDKTGTMKIAVIGPNAFDIYSQLGDYTPPVLDGVTIADGIKAYATQHENLKVTFSQGCQGADSAMLIDQAEQQSAEADVTILVLGGTSSRFGDVSFDKNGAAVTSGEVHMDCGEGVDLSSLKLPDEQLAMADRVYQAAKKTITIVIAGRPYNIGAIVERTDALLYSFYPGPKGGRAIAELLFADAVPSGRLPVSFPRDAARLPSYYNYRNSYQAMHYADGQDGPLYAFGYGMAYDEMTYSDFSVSKEVIGISELMQKPVLLKMVMENRSKRPVFGVPMVFTSRLGGSVAPRASELKGFEKILLYPGESKSVTIKLEHAAFSCWNEQMIYKTEPGRVRIQVKDGGHLLWSKEIKLKD